ncbi:GNAT family N-acetyltransferase [Nocardia sp. NPDC049220]|uniref:GNAT family N-acetyltransferase n=1 Tax=Nocardia sp. NPDC049220 TaxID=3155273 RepID=UPI0033C14353
MFDQCIESDSFGVVSDAAIACGALFGTRQWHEFMIRTTADDILDHCLFSFENTVGETSFVPLYLLSGSVYWRMGEVAANMTENVLRYPVAVLSSLYSFSNPLNSCSSSEGVLQVLDRALDAAEGWSAEALLVTNLEFGPALSVLRDKRPPDSEIRLDATCRARLPKSLDDYIGTLSKSGRSDMRRRHRRASEAGVKFVQRWGSDAIDYLPQFLALTEQVASNHDNPPVYDLATLEAATTVPGMVLLTAEADGRILAGSITFIHQDSCVVWSAGVHYPALNTHHPYVFLFAETVELAIALGCRWVDYGRRTYEFKRRHGLYFTDLHTFVYHTSKTDAGLGSRMRQMDESMSAYMGF